MWDDICIKASYPSFHPPLAETMPEEEGYYEYFSLGGGERSHVTLLESGKHTFWHTINLLHNITKILVGLNKICLHRLKLYTKNLHIM
jgi:hypothetical protein